MDDFDGLRSVTRRQVLEGRGRRRGPWRRPRVPRRMLVDGRDGGARTAAASQPPAAAPAPPARRPRRGPVDGRQRQRHARFELLGRGPEEASMQGSSTRSRQTTGIAGQGQHGRPRHVPGPDQHLPPGHAGRRVHLVLRASGCGSSPTRASRPTSSDVWAKVGGNFTDAFKVGRPATTASSTSSRSTTTRGPSSTARACSRTRATPSRRRWDEFKALGHKMQADGLIPIAFGDKDGWPAMGTFDILNLRLKRLRLPRRPDGRQGEVDRPEGQGGLREVGRAPPVLPGGLRRPDLAGRRRHARPEEGRHVPARAVRVPAVPGGRRGRPRRPRLLPVPEPRARSSTPRRRSTRRSTAFRSPPSRRSWPTELDAVKAFIEYLGQAADPGDLVSQDQPGNIAAAKDADTSGYTDLQKKAAEIIGGAQRITQFLDRDTRPTSPGRTACRPSCRLPQEPDQDLDAFLKIQDFWDTL